jgi:hypothetical protein
MSAKGMKYSMCENIKLEKCTKKEQMKGKKFLLQKAVAGVFKSQKRNLNYAASSPRNAFPPRVEGFGVAAVNPKELPPRIESSGVIPYELPPRREESGVVVVLPPAPEANAAIASEGLLFIDRIARIFVTLRPKARAPCDNCLRAFLAGFRSNDVKSTEMMGATEAMVSNPKPSDDPRDVEKPIPIDRTIGTEKKRKKEEE